MAGKKISKFFRVGVEGATCDGRTIERHHIQQMADSYDPAVYGARINLEHIKGYTPDSPFRRYGDVVALKAEEISEGPLKGKLALLASISPTDDLIGMTKAKQKVYTSMEIDPKFADTGKAYLVGLAVTDDPASLGTEMLEFSARASHNPLASRKTRPENLFTAAEEASLEFEDDGPDNEGPGLFARVKALLTKSQQRNQADFSEVHQAVEAVAETTAETAGQVATLGGKFSQLSGELTELKEKLEQNTSHFNELKAKLEQESATPPRAPATGAGAEHIDCL